MEKTLGKRIVYHRKRLNLTQDRMAELLGVTAQAVSKWENDQSCPDIAMLPRLAELFGISTDELLGMEHRQETVHQAELVTEQDGSGQLEHDTSVFELKWDSGKKFSIGLAVLVLLVGGLLLAGEIWNLNLSFWSTLWPSALLVFGLLGLFSKFSFLCVGCILFGGYFLAEEVGILPFDLSSGILFPAALVLLGMSLLADALRKKKKPSFRVSHNGKPFHSSGEFISSCTVEDERFYCEVSFGDKKEYITLPRLSGGKIDLSFGEIIVDLRGCESVSEDCTIDVSCSFGEANILVPSRFMVMPASDTTFASVEVHGIHDANICGTVRINGDASFGAIEIHYV